MTDERPDAPRPSGGGPGPAQEPDEFAWLYGDGPRPQPDLRRRLPSSAPTPGDGAAGPPRPGTSGRPAPRPRPGLPPDSGPYRRPAAAAAGPARPSAPEGPAGPGRTALLPVLPPSTAPARPPGGPARPAGPMQPAGPVQPAGPARPGQPAPSGRRRRRHPVRRVLVALLVVVLLLAGGLVGLGEYAWGKVGRIQAFPTARIPVGAGTTFLLIGSDSRAGLTQAQRNALGTGSDAGARTDSIMVVDIPSDGSKPAIVSIPRDSYVAIPGHGHNKINAAFAFGGAPLLVRTIESDTGLHIDHVVEIGFGGFAGLVDDLDGVRICSKTAVDDVDAHIDIKAGCQLMTGRTALGYVRARHFDPLGDLGRVQRQRQVLSAIVAKATSAQTLLHPGRLWSLASNGGTTLSVDDRMHSWDALTLARAVRDVSGGDGVTTTVPIADANATTAAGSSVLWDNGQAATLFRALQAGHGVPAALVSGSGVDATP